MENVASLSDTEIKFISDFSKPLQTHFLELLSQTNLPVSTYSLEKLVTIQDDQIPCPRFTPTTPDNISILVSNAEMIKKQDAIPIIKHYMTLLIWVSPRKIPELMKFLSETIIWCEQYKDLGVYQRNSKLLILSNDFNTTQDILRDKNVQRHQRVASVVPLGSGKFAFWNYNLFNLSVGDEGADEFILKYVSDRSKRIRTLEEIYQRFDDFNGHKISVVLVPWSFVAIGTYFPDEKGGTDRNRYTNYWGSEIDMLNALGDKLNIEFEIQSQPDELWGFLDPETGEWLGMVKDSADGICDMALGIMPTYERAKVMEEI